MEDDDEAIAAEKEKQREAKRDALVTESNKMFNKWLKKDIDWAGVYGAMQFPDNPPSTDLVRDLMHLDMGTLYTKLAKDSSLGFIPLMASCSPGQLGVLNAESFCERVISQANLVMTSGNSLLS